MSQRNRLNLSLSTDGPRRGYFIPVVPVRMALFVLVKTHSKEKKKGGLRFNIWI